MTSRRITRALGAAVGGLLGAAYLPAAFAVADDIVITPDPSSTELVSGFYGLHNVTAPPAVPGTVQGEQLFDYHDITTGDSGTFYGYESIDQAYRDDDLYLVGQDQTGAQDPLNPGSVIETETQGPHNETIYSDLTSATGGKDVSTETTVNAFGTHTYHDSFDPSQYISDKYLDSNVPLGTSGYEFVPTGDENVTAVNGLQPLDIDAQGTQEFNLVGPNGVVGTFDAVQTNTGDTFGNYTEQLLVTQDLSGPQGTAPGDVPTVGSIYNIFYHNSPDRYSLYSDIPDNGKDNISYINVDNGQEHVTDAKNDLDVIKSEDLSKFEVPSQNDITMTPTTDTIHDFSGVNGIPPYDNAVQGYEQFDITSSSGQPIGVVDADVTNILRSDGHFSEAVLVTGVESGTAGTGTGDVPPVGSVFDMVTHGSGQNYLIYSDMPSQSGDVISKYSVKADGAAHALPGKLDLAAGLSHDQFIDPFASGGVSSADAASSVDTSALASSVDTSALASSVDTSALASSLDPSGAISADSVTDPLLHSGALLDPLPHIEAALQFLTGLF